MKNNQAVLKIKDLSKVFGKIKAVNRINLSVHLGDMFGLLGPNGSGKTTTIRMICGLLKPTSGEIELLQHNLNEGTLYRSLIGYLPQQDAIYGDLTAYENMCYFGSIYGVNMKDIKVRIKEYSARLGLDERLDQLVKTLSSGYRRRVAMVCSLMHDPPFIILDEPTLGLDPIIRLEFWNFIQELKDKGKTVLVTTHHMEEADNCDRLAIMREGVIIAEGEPGELKMSLFKTTTIRFEDVYLALARFEQERT